MKTPKQCVLWKKPELVIDVSKNLFEVIDTYVDEDHFKRGPLKCRECGQLYFKEFLEEIDWLNGNDPQYRTFVPVETQDEIETLKQTSRFELLQFFPRLQSDWPSDAKKPTVRWM